jgi:hypothetical protein
MIDPWIKVEDWLIDFKIQEQKIRLHSQQTPTRQNIWIEFGYYQ